MAFSSKLFISELNIFFEEQKKDGVTNPKTKLAEDIGKSPQTISNYLRGSQPSWETAMKINDHTGIIMKVMGY